MRSPTGRWASASSTTRIAVAARHAIDGLGLKRVLILDWDVHHGNGTSDIFWETDEVLLISIHEWPLYPGGGRLWWQRGAEAPGTP